MARVPLVLLLVFGLASTARAQDDGIPTLRVYTNLLQVPTLVLSNQQKPLPPIPGRRFFVSIDGGNPFRATHVRVEGEDPIALEILADVEHLPENVSSKLREAIPALAPVSVHATDGVTLYALNCQLSRATVEKPTSTENLQTVATLLLDSSRMHGKSHNVESCRQRWNLLDSIMASIRGLQDEPARRVLLVMTDGVDHGSKAAWDEVRVAAQMYGVAIFAMLPRSEMFLPVRGPRGTLGSEAVTAATNMPSLCESTGGMILDADQGSVLAQMRSFMTLVRGRYIIEFPRPPAGPGTHNLTVTIEKLAAFIRPAGVSVPVADPELAKDPNTILPDPANAPEVGTKRPKQ